MCSVVCSASPHDHIGDGIRWCFLCRWCISRLCPVLSRKMYDLFRS
jgi:hypothetical protein